MNGQDKHAAALYPIYAVINCQAPGLYEARPDKDKMVCPGCDRRCRVQQGGTFCVSNVPDGFDYRGNVGRGAA